MKLLAELACAVPDCIVAAWIDTLSGRVIEQHIVRDGPEVSASLDAATEVMRTRERPPRMVLLSSRCIHIIQRSAEDRRRAVVVICDRSPNIGLAVALVRTFAEAEAA
jgi:hypothetical protein